MKIYHLLSTQQIMIGVGKYTFNVGYGLEKNRPILPLGFIHLLRVKQNVLTNMLL